MKRLSLSLAVVILALSSAVSASDFEEDKQYISCRKELPLSVTNHNGKVGVKVTAIIHSANKMISSILAWPATSKLQETA